MLDFDPASQPAPNGHFINGKLDTGISQSLPVHRPSDGKAFTEIPVADSETVDHEQEDQQ